MLWIRTDYPGATDEQVLHAAQADKRILLTLDKDFGELAFRSGLPADCGVILFRLTLSSPEYIGKIAVAAEHHDRMERSLCGCRRKPSPFGSFTGPVSMTFASCKRFMK